LALRFGKRQLTTTGQGLLEALVWAAGAMILWHHLAAAIEKPARTRQLTRPKPQAGSRQVHLVLDAKKPHD
jgi:hypothetical protein